MEVTINWKWTAEVPNEINLSLLPVSGFVLSKNLRFATIYITINFGCFTGTFRQAQTLKLGGVLCSGYNIILAIMFLSTYVCKATHECAVQHRNIESREPNIIFRLRRGSIFTK